MARVNFGRTPTVRGYNPLANTLKPGHVIQMRGQFYLVDAVEGLTFELVVTANGNTAGTEISDGFDSGYFEDEDLEPYRNHLYCLIPSLAGQPKFIARDGTFDGVGFPNDTTQITLSSGTHTVGGASRTMVGLISPRVYLKHPAGIPRWHADEAPENDKTGFLDVTISPHEDPNPNFAIWIESGESQLPQFRMVNTTGEVYYNPVIFLQGFKARLKPMSKVDIQKARDANGGKFVYKIIKPQGLPHAGNMAADFNPN
ncbi:MAG: hypothetical protein CMA60_00105 [Euryarchaeota archaeon]|nr:hypothetical protein [Euryarchaeota archaeon]